ncbi:enhancer of mRNA-decapping protein 4-like [Iris pallida]|uniref:Enhancer of mRNA-decapping protein 4-like n=1 Tax=Iris pallida TaxID=29817 RepID=A0AAX6EG19_IRIPA|nr:enhancer of mRNA-decapping protein 4-like [Iris pallida]
MASSPPFDMLFKPPNPNPNPNLLPNPNPNLPPNPNPNFYSPHPQRPYSYPPPTGPTPPFHHPHHHQPFLHYPQAPLPQNPNPNDGARLMALLNTTSPPPHLDSAVSMPPSAAPRDLPAILHAAPSAPPAPVARLPSGKMPRGRVLAGGERAAYDVDARAPRDSPPQLEVTPITKYVSDPGLVLGRQIAVNKTYICYGLKLGAIRVLNINTALRSLLRGHTQRVTDMAFFAEDVHLLASASVDGRVFVWKIDEGPDDQNTAQITGRIVVAIQIVGDEESYHPRICWHSHKQEVLIVAIGNLVLRIDTTKVGRGKAFSAEEPLKCPVEKLIDGVQFIGKHEGEVTDLSISQWMTTRLASASKDGTVKIWDDRKAVPLAVLRPHEGLPVSSVAFLTSPHCPEHIVLITAGPLNREVKIWTSTNADGWLFPSDTESWQCTQTLELRSSAEPRFEEAFFNQVVVLPRASLVLLANAKKNAIYAVHVDYGQCPASTRMDYVADFTVTMPILSVTGTSDSLPSGEQVVQVYCVQTQAIQQYALDLAQCLPPVDALLGRDSAPRVLDSSGTEGIPLELSQGSTVSAHPVGSVSPRLPLSGNSSENAPASLYPVVSVSTDVFGIREMTTSNVEAKPSAPPLPSSNFDNALPVASPGPLNMDLSSGISLLRNPSKDLEQSPSLDRDVVQAVVDYSAEGRVDTVTTTVPDVSSRADNLARNESKTGLNDSPVVPNSHLMYKLAANATHLVTPSEILLGAISSSDSTLADQGQKGDQVKVQEVVSNSDMSVDAEGKLVDDSGLDQHEQIESQKEPQVVNAGKKDKSLSNITSEANTEMPKDSCSTTSGTYTEDVAQTGDGVTVSDAINQPSFNCNNEAQDNTKHMTEKASASSSSTVLQSPTVSKGKKQKSKQTQASVPSSPPLSPYNSIDFSNEPGSNTGLPSNDSTFSQFQSMQEALNQLLSTQKEMLKQMNGLVAPINKEGKRLEASLGRSMEKAIKANMDALWARFLEENAKHDKVERERIQQMTSLITNFVNKDIPSMLEKALKKEVSSVGPSVARAVTPAIEKCISSAITDCFQRGIGDKAVSQLEKTVNSKLEATVARQIQTQFQTSGKQALQEALRSSLESSVVPAFDRSCKAMFEQVDAVFQKGMNEHTSAAQQQFDSMHTPLSLTLREAINSASSITQNLTSELADGQRKLLALVAESTKALNPVGVQQSNGPMAGLPEMAFSVQQVEAPLDPTKELSRLVSEHKFGEAFTMALQRSDVSIVSWLCSQVDLHAICSMVPVPLNQGVLLALLQQLACDISKETSRKLGWITDVAVAINPTDPMIVMHIRPIFEQVYNILAHQRSLPTTSSSEATSIRVIMHVINSVLLSCK